MIETITIIGILILGVAIFGYFGNRKWENKLKNLNSNRPNLSRSEYIENYVDKGFEKKHIGVVYDEIKNFIELDNFSMHPTDDIYEIYRIEELDIMEIIDSICERLKIRKAEKSEFDSINKLYENVTTENILALTRKITD